MVLALFQRGVCANVEGKSGFKLRANLADNSSHDFRYLHP